MLMSTQALCLCGQVYTQKQRHNTKLWAHVKGALSAAIAQLVCEAGTHTTSILRS